MKNLLFLFVFLGFYIQGFGQSANTVASKGPNANFTETTFEFGDIVQGTKVEHTYKFQNTGTEPLIINEVVTTCGCTATKWNKEPILPGKGGEIQVTFDSTGKEGRKNQVITILSNGSNSPSRISLVANVLPPTKQ